VAQGLLSAAASPEPAEAAAACGGGGGGEQAALAELRRLRARASDAGLLPAHGGTTMQKLRIVRLGFGTARQKMVLK
jgi:hypothetical protein